MRHLERRRGSLAAWRRSLRARGVDQNEFLALHGGMGQRAAARCRNLDFSALQGGMVVLLRWTM